MQVRMMLLQESVSDVGQKGSLDDRKDGDVRLTSAEGGGSNFNALSFKRPNSNVPTRFMEKGIWSTDASGKASGGKGDRFE